MKFGTEVAKYKSYKLFMVHEMLFVSQRLQKWRQSETFRLYPIKLTHTDSTTPNNFFITFK